jgi:hypothetical protein
MIDFNRSNDSLEIKSTRISTNFFEVVLIETLVLQSKGKDMGYASINFLKIKMAVKLMWLLF